MKGKTEMKKETVTDLMTIPEGADMFKKSEAALRQDIWRGRLPFRKIGGRIYLVRSEIEALIAKSPGRRLDEIISSKD